VTLAPEQQVYLGLPVKRRLATDLGKGGHERGHRGVDRDPGGQRALALIGLGDRHVTRSEDCSLVRKSGQVR
jgi:hypothetical protein